MDIEFTIDDGKLYILQCRTMKRTPLARVNILMSLALEGLIDRSEFLADHIEPISTQTVQAPAGVKPYARGVPISGSFLTGKVTLRKEPEPGMILFRNYTETDDLPHMLKAQAIVTSIGGPTCHAALVARDFNIPAIVGTGVKVSESYISNGVTRLLEGALVTITPDGSIYEGQVDFKTETMISVDYERYLRLRKLVEG